MDYRYAPAKAARPRRIIVIDDESYLTTVVATKLRQAGYSVSTAANGEEGFALAAAGDPPDLIITDFEMPVLSGFDMSVRLKNHRTTANVPLLMLTARAHSFTPAQLAQTNIRAVCPKPFSARELVEKVQGLLGEGKSAIDAEVSCR
ncbi:MAG TPA: response regulator [Tepidisphaeraceae bacterium]|jgi:DNA-binding response OmpR family regulator